MAEHILYPSGGVDFSGAAAAPAPVVSSWDAPPIVRRSLQSRRRDPQINQNVFVPTVAAPAVVAAWDEVYPSRGYSAKIRTIHIAAAVGTDSSEFSWERLVGWDSSADVYRAAMNGQSAAALASWHDGTGLKDIVVIPPAFDYLTDQVEEHGGRILRSMVARAERIRQSGTGSGRSDEIVGGSSIWPRMWHLWRRR